MSKQHTLHKLQAEKEFEVYSKIWQLATELRFALEGLRPSVDWNTGEVPREKWQRRYEKTNESGRGLLNEAETQRPFYPDRIYRQLKILLQNTWEEIVDFEFSLDPQKENMSFEGYVRGRSNFQKIVTEMDQVCDLMRSRITETQ